MGIFTAKTAGLVTAFCAATYGVVTGAAGPIGTAIGGAKATLAFHALVKSIFDENASASAIILADTSKVIAEKFSTLEKSGEYSSGQLTIAQAALEGVLAKLDFSTDKLMGLDRNSASMTEWLMACAIEQVPADFGKNNRDPQAKINRDILKLILLTGFEKLESTPEVEAKLQRFFQAEVLQRLATVVARQDKLLDGQATIGSDVKKVLELLKGTGSAASAREAGVHDEAIVKLSQRVAEDVRDPQEALRELERAVDIAIKVQEQGHMGSNLDEFVAEVLRKVAELSGRGEFEAAARESEQAYDRWQERQQREQQIGVKLLESGLNTYLQLRDHRKAAEKLLEIAKIKTPEQLSEFEHLRKVQDEWYERGLNHGLTLDLQVSASLAELIVKEAQSEDQKGTALNDWAIALVELGGRAEGQAGLDYLDAAVAGYGLALEVRKRETMPVQWAMTQMNRAVALSNLGERAEGQVGFDYLDAAVAGYDLALEVNKREIMPVEWAKTQMNRAIVLRNLGERVEGQAGLDYLDKAVAGYDLALEVYNREAMPVDWAMTQMNRAGALQRLGERAEGQAGLDYLDAAVAGYDLALEVYKCETMPVDWAMTQMNRANVLLRLGERAEGQAGLDYLDAAVAGYDLALEVFDGPGMEYYTQATRDNRAIAVKVLAARQRR